MEPDIDIEEHDVLDNPAIKSIFPDLTKVKTEIFVDEASTSNTAINVEVAVTRILSEDNYPLSSRDRENPSTAILSNTINPHTFSNKIILGSRPTQPKQYTNYNFEKTVKPFSARVYINDISSYLNNSSKFCTKCNILFPERSNLLSHMRTYHKKNCNSRITKIKYGTTRVSCGVFERPMCQICLKTFSRHSNLTKHMKRFHPKVAINKSNRPDKKTKYFISVNKKKQSTQNTRTSTIDAFVKKVTSTVGNECFHCKQNFSSQKCLIEHIYKVLQSKKNTTRRQIIRPTESVRKTKLSTRTQSKVIECANTQKEQNKNTHEKPMFYRCCYCSYYLRSKSFYATHLVKKHKDSNFYSMTKVMFNGNCQFCSSVSLNHFSFNVHLQSQHKEKIEKTFKIEPIICIPRVDTNKKHEENSNRKEKVTHKDKIKSKTSYDILTQCLDDENNSNISELTKDEQDSTVSCIDNDSQFMNTTNSLNVEMLVLKDVLFKCKRCDIHFLSAKSAMNHTDHMEMLINWKCLYCQKIFKKDDENIHNIQHSFSEEFIVYDLDELQLIRVLYKCTKCNIHFHSDNYKSHFEKCGEFLSEFTHCKKCNIAIEVASLEHHQTQHESDLPLPIDFTIVHSDVLLSSSSNDVPDDMPIPIKKSNRYIERFNKLIYCRSCKCFLGRVTLRKVHKDGRCTHINKSVCKDCGLVLTSQSLKSHLRRHKLVKDLKLQDFKFYDLKNGKLIRPPIPEYPKCKSCNIHFTSKNYILMHLCHANDFLTCPVCDIKLSEEAFKLHMAFHNYYITKNKNSILRNTLLGITKNVKQKRQAKENKHKRSDVDIALKVGDDNKKGLTTVNEIDMVPPRNTSCNKTRNRLHAFSKAQTKKSSKVFYAKKTNTDLKLFCIAYCCASCYITVDLFDKAVEHCQDHYNDTNFELYSIKCVTCKLTYDERFYADHTSLHNFKLNGKGFTFLQFDPIYFINDYKLWLKLLFKSMESQKVQSILDSSIYKYEGRIKLRVVQEGTTELIVYKCNSCHVYIDPDTIFGHSENSCFTQRIHPCSVCGLPFISHVSRITHEIVHKQCSNINHKSYKIVTFDREKDHEYNRKIMTSRNNFVLYKCRLCNGTFDRFQSRDHMCNKCDLKKCVTCGLLTYSADYKSHNMKHTIIENYVHNNMTIIFFGDFVDHKSTNGLPPDFDGIIVNYSFYKCSDCGLCCRKIDDMSWMIKHNCVDDNIKVKCVKCDLILLKKHLNQHLKQHENDIYFNRKNFNFILCKKSNVDLAPADSTSEISTPINQISHTANSVDVMPVNTANECNKICPNILEKVTKIYKCNCGLHFLERNSIRSHFGHCMSRISKQNCSKCGLQFTPKELFNHLLQHHGDKKYTFKMHVIEMSQDKHNVVDLYNCTTCDINFVDIEQARAHLVNCPDTTTERRQCHKCCCYFSSSSIDVHESSHHSAEVADINIIDICGEFTPTEQEETDALKIQKLVAQADDVIGENRYNLTDDWIAQINLSSYNNIVYKCNECNIHFLVENTFRQHLARHKPFASSLQDSCPVCGLNFSLPSLAKHIYIHHTHMKLDLENIIIRSEAEISSTNISCS